MCQTTASSTATSHRLWSVVADVTAWPGLLPTFTSVTPVGRTTTMGPGARFNVAQPGLPPMTYTVTEWAAGSSFTWQAWSPGILTRASHRVEAVGGGSRLTLSITWEGVLAGVVARLLGSRARAMIELEATTLAWVADGDA